MPRKKYQKPAGAVCKAYIFAIDEKFLSHQKRRDIASHLGAKRFAWNWMLDYIQNLYHGYTVMSDIAMRSGASREQAQKWAKDLMGPVPYSLYAMNKVWNKAKAEQAPWWSQNSKESYRAGFEALSLAIGNFYSSRKGERKGPVMGWPKFKKKNKAAKSVAFTTGAIKVVDKHHLQLPRIGRLRTLEPTDKLRLKLKAGQAHILRASLSRKGGRLFVSFNVTVSEKTVSVVKNGIVGIDVGIKRLATMSDGTVLENPQAFDKVQQRKRRYQRQMSRQHRTGSPKCFAQNGVHIQGKCYWNNRSKRSERTLSKLQKAEHKAASIRKDVIHKLSHRLATTKTDIAIEDLNVKGMGRSSNHGFNRVLYGAAMSELRRQLGYKCKWSGSNLWLVSRWYPSSKTCSSCKVVKDKLPLAIRTFHCEACGLTMDRDENAALNIEHLLAELKAQINLSKKINYRKLQIRPFGLDLKTPAVRGSVSETSKASGDVRLLAAKPPEQTFNRKVVSVSSKRRLHV
jgi:putative transposase